MSENINKFCKVEDCWEISTRKGFCSKHYQRMYLYGRLEKVKGIIKGNCTIDGCNEKIKGHGLCSKHYQLWRTTGRVEKLKREKRSHVFYPIWWERKSNNLLCDAWLDFTTFVKDIGSKPEGEYFLVRLDGTKLFGPDNFQWQLHLKRQEGESNKEWWARKRAARISANPSMERARNYKRRFGLSLEEINEKLKSQNFKCAICKKPETSIDGRTGSIKTLSLDHCHSSSKVRELLCWRCNATLGKAEDDIELLQEMINYLNKHKELINGSRQS